MVILIYLLAIPIGIALGTVALVTSLWFVAPDTFKSSGARSVWVSSASLVTVFNLLSLTSLASGLWFIGLFVLAAWFAVLLLLFVDTVVDAIVLTLANFSFNMLLAWPFILLVQRFG